MIAAGKWRPPKQRQALARSTKALMGAPDVARRRELGGSVVIMIARFAHGSPRVACLVPVASSTTKAICEQAAEMAQHCGACTPVIVRQGAAAIAPGALEFCGR